MTEYFSAPSLNRLSQFAQPSLEKMICSFDHHQLLRLGHRRFQRLQLRPRTELIARSTDKQLRLRALSQKVERINARLFLVSCDWSNRHSYTNQCLHPRIVVRGP